MYYCGLDVSLRETAICIVDAEGKILKEAKVASDPDAIARTIMDSGYICEKIVIAHAPFGHGGGCQ
jgi:predicted NBD/HSP70 family sugar kinase